MGERKATRVRASAAASTSDTGGHARAVRAASVSQSVALPPYETVSLVLQGGGALGSYQAGV